MTATRVSTLALLALAATSASASTTSRSGAIAPAASLPAGVLDRVFASGSDSVRGGSPVTVYTDRAAFLAAVAPGYAEHDFSEIAPGTTQPIQYTDGSDSWHYVIFTGVFATHPLYNGDGYISTDRVDDPISVATSIFDPPFTAIGANVWPSDFSLQPTSGQVVLTVLMQDGTIGATETVDTSGSDDFRGFVATAPIAGLFVDAPEIDPPVPGQSQDRWATLDNLVIGSATP
ncbi:hypothetical protein FHW12_003540 [Dokdonella fugitiva]|uniref:Uncharacterized protein n=1 Tax=Dokdonella fugitiva TaxID=328517 RepID=A0A839EX95_9GAMM|nr:hypothetical protein [Dokdonella fugitiva]MBA8889297.1 hypothetical protein [Dokdonella fugitiva]